MQFVRPLDTTLQGFHEFYIKHNNPHLLGSQHDLLLTDIIESKSKAVILQVTKFTILYSIASVM